MFEKYIFTIAPASEFQKRKLLFDSIGQTLGISFIADSSSETVELAGKILFCSGAPKSHDNSTPTLSIVSPCITDSPNNFEIEVSNLQTVSPLVRGVSLRETHHWHPVEIPLLQGDCVLAKSNGSPIWVRKESSVLINEVVCMSLTELSDEEILKDRFIDGNAFSLLTVIHFIRSVLDKRGYINPPLRAAFIIDDPNLRFSTYGCINYPALVKIAEQHNFHVALATIPLDMSWISKNIGHFAIQHRRQLSLAFHGNNHIHNELNQQDISLDTEFATIAQALKRTNSFVNRYGIPVSKVMIPPHEQCSRNMLGVLRKLGFEAVFASRPEPWHRLASPNRNVLHRCFPSDFVDGMPIIHRQASTDNFRFDAMLGQPLVTYFHHNDFADGYDLLCEQANTINSLGNIQWQPLDDIARSNYQTQTKDETLFIRPFSRNIKVQLPLEINQVVIDMPKTAGLVEGTYLDVDGVGCPIVQCDTGYITTPIPVNKDQITSLILLDLNVGNIKEMPDPKFSYYPIIRRFLTETRDRFYPFYYGFKKLLSFKGLNT